MSDDITNDLMLLRDLMARELDTINHYRQLADSAPDADAREFFTHIIEEEKIHIADAMRAIATLDVEQARLMTIGYAAGHLPGQIPAESGTTGSGQTALPEESGSRSPGLTIGSLRGLPQD